jgi:ATP-dependent Zn protease
VTRFRFENEELSATKAQYEAVIAAALGGYAAEEIVFGKSNVTSGASSDLLNANQITSAMVTELAMADDRSFLVDHIIPQGSDFITTNANRILERAYATASRIITTNRSKLDILAKALLERETLDHIEVARLLGLPADKH